MLGCRMLILVRWVKLQIFELWTALEQMLTSIQWFLTLWVVQQCHEADWLGWGTGHRCRCLQPGTKGAQQRGGVRRLEIQSAWIWYVGVEAVQTSAY